MLDTIPVYGVFEDPLLNDKKKQIMPSDAKTYQGYVPRTVSIDILYMQQSSDDD